MLRYIPPPNAARYALARENYFKTYNTVSAAKLGVYHLRWPRNGTDSTYILERVRDAWFVLYEVTSGMDKADYPWKAAARTTLHYLRDTNKAVPMSADDYATWRLAVERELTFGNLTDSYSASLFTDIPTSFGGSGVAFSHGSIGGGAGGRH